MRRRQKRPESGGGKLLAPGRPKAIGALPFGVNGPPDRLRPCGLHAAMVALTPHASAAEAT